MKALLFMIVLMTLPFCLHAQDKEGDLQLPVSDITAEMQEEEERLPPTIDEVPIREEKDKRKKKSTKKRR